MPTPRWDLFVAVAILATLALLALSRASARAIGADGGRGNRGSDDFEAETVAQGEGGTAAGPIERARPPVPSGVALLANVALTHGLLGVTVLALAWFSGVPPAALGLADVGVTSVGIGVGLGVGLYLASEAGSYLTDRLGVEYDERLRELLAPEGPAEWALLLLVILPIVAGGEELLFRAALVGVVGAGFGVPAWVLVVGSSVLFGLGHSAQGTLGVAVTAALGIVLATAFVLTGSFLVVFVAHYVVNALEFVVREGILG